MGGVDEKILSGETPWGDLSPAERSGILQSLATGQMDEQAGVICGHLMNLFISGMFKPGTKNYMQASGILIRCGVDHVVPWVTDKTGARVFLNIFGIEAGIALPKNLFDQAKGRHLEDVLGL